MIDNEEKEFTQFIEENLLKARNIVAQCDKYAKTALCVTNSFVPTLLTLIKRSEGSKVIKCPISAFVKEDNNYDLRKEMDNELINQIASMGYKYCIEESKANELVFRMGDNKSLCGDKCLKIC